MPYKDPEQDRQYKAQWYKKNKDRVTARVRKNDDRYRKKAQQYVWALKERTPCADCHKKYPHYVMDFDHLDDQHKERNISKMVTHGYSLKRVQAEIAKCEIVCANCHRTRTWKRSQQPDGGETPIDQDKETQHAETQE